MLDDCAADLALEWICREKRSFQIEQIVEGKLLSPLLCQTGEALSRPLCVKSRALTGILALAECLPATQRKCEAVRKIVESLARKPPRDCSIVRSGVSKDFFGEKTAQIQIVVIRVQSGEHPRVVRRIHNHRDGRKVLRCRAKH